MKRIAVLYSASPSNLHVIHALREEGYQLTLIETIPSKYEMFQMIVRRKKDHLFAKIDRLAFLFFMLVRLKLSMNRAIKKELKTTPVCNALTVREVNDPVVLQTILRSSVDCILTLGTEMLASSWFSQPIPMMNLHVGVMPFYRGRFCWLWPVINGDHKNWGVSVHAISAKADAGALYAVVSEDPRVSTDLSLTSLLIRISALSVVAIAHALQKPVIHSHSNMSNALGPHYLEPRLSKYLTYRLRR